MKNETLHWYNNTLENSINNDKVVTKGFCNDTSGLQLSKEYGFSSGPTSMFAAGNRLAQSFSNFAKDNAPTLTCPDVSDVNLLKVGLITGDELVFGGESYNVTNNGYLSMEYDFYFF